MKSKLLNFIENLNETAIYLSCYFMFIFTEWIPDIETRYSLGYFYLPMFLAIVAINLGCVFYEMFKVFLRSKLFVTCRDSVRSKIDAIKFRQRIKAD